MFPLAWAVNNDTGRVFGVKENAQASTTRNEIVRPTQGLSETRELGCAVSARGGTKECQYAETAHNRTANDSNQMFRRDDRKNPSSHIITINIASEAAICDKLPARRLNTS